MKYDVIIWAHSDQAGGTEMPCVIASALRRRTGLGIRCAIVTPFPEAVLNFFKQEGGLHSSIDFIPSPKLLEIAKDKDGNVSKTETIRAAAELFRDLRGHVNKCCELVRDRFHQNTLMVSCGEPIALEVARRYGMRATIFTDHLVLRSVDSIFTQSRGTWPKGVDTSGCRECLDELIKYERALPPGEAFLSPNEFAGPEYSKYLSDREWKCLELGGLLYDPIPLHELECAPDYKMLADLNKEAPIVIVFGGGGKVWDGIYSELHRKIRQGKLSEFCLIVRDIDRNNRVVPRTWRLFKRHDTNGTALQDPGK